MGIDRGRRWRMPIALGAASLALLGLVPAPASASKTVVNTIGGVKVGIKPAAGIHGEQFASPRGMAVNESGAGGVPAGTFYVVDGENNRIQQFGPDARFVRAWGWGVKDGDPEFEACSVAASCVAGIAGSGAGQMSAPMGAAVDQATGIVYVTDQGNRRVDAFSAAGAFEGAFGWGALDGGEALQVCSAGSGCHEPASPGGAAGQFGEQLGFPAVDSSGAVYVADRSNSRVDVFAPALSAGAISGVSFLRAFGWDVAEAGDPGDTLAGEFEVCSTLCKAGVEGSGLGQFGFLGPAEIAIGPSGDVYALESGFGSTRVQKFSSAPAPLESEFGAAALSSAFGGGVLLGIAVDGTSGHVLVSGDRQAESGRLMVAELDAGGALVDTHGSDLVIANTGGLFPVVSGGLAVAPASLGGNVYVSVGENEQAHAIFVLNEAPVVDPVTVHTGTMATFEGEVVSDEFQVEYHFEYSIDGKTWTSLPTEEISAGAAPARAAVSQNVTGLTGSQPYRVRLVQNRAGAGGRATSSEATFTTDAAPPAITDTGATAITDTSATLRALVDPQNQTTEYRFEYGAQGSCDSAPCTPTAPASVGPGGGPTPISAQIAGLEPATTYHLRLVAENGSGTTEGPDATFTTYPDQTPDANCPNQVLRTAFSELLPDCRAYELVTPEDHGGHAPSFQSNGAIRNGFATPTASPDGANVLFKTRLGALPGTDGTGVSDVYSARRGPAGWDSVLVGPTGAQMEAPVVGGFSSDHEYGFVQAATEGRGTLDGPGAPGGADYLRRADGQFEALGRGSLVPEDKTAEGNYISAGGEHVVFSSKEHLEPDTPGAGVKALYDRTPGGPTQVVSLGLGNAPLATSSEFKGSSSDGSTILFSSPEGTTINAGKKLYARVDGTVTYEVATGGSGAAAVTPAGTSRNGDAVFYVQGGNVFLFDTVSQVTTQATSVGNAQVVNVSEDGSHVYFVSTSQIGGEGAAGQPNLYVWSREGATTAFVATVTSADLSSGFPTIGLARWTTDVASATTATRGPLNETSRSTPDGTTLAFQSRAKLTSYENAGHVEIYLYHVGDSAPSCVSCNPTGIAASGDASLATSGNNFSGALLAPIAQIPNLSEDGATVFFESEDALVPRDTNGVRDVYEWHAGKVSLISSGKGAQPSYVYGATPDGHDVFFFTHDTLLPRDRNAGAGSIYDARIDGGFAEPGASPSCNGDGCQTSPGVTPPGAGSPASETLVGSGNVKHRRHRRHRHRHHRHRRHRAHGHRRAER